MKSVPMFLKGPFRNALKFGPEETSAQGMRDKLEGGSCWCFCPGCCCTVCRSHTSGARWQVDGIGQAGRRGLRHSGRRRHQKISPGPFLNSSEAATVPHQYALSTRAGCECVAHALQGLVDPDSTVVSIDLISRESMMTGPFRTEAFAFLDDIYVVTRPERVGKVYRILEEALRVFSCIRIHNSKAQPEDCDRWSRLHDMRTPEPQCGWEVGKKASKKSRKTMGF